MIRSFNYTRRKRISRDDVRITLFRRAGQPLSFDADLSLERYELPAEAQVFVEAYRQTTYMRFPFGTVSAPAPEKELLLTDFGASDAMRFRVKVVGVGEAVGRLLAEADRLLPRAAEEAEDRRVPLLPVRSADLGEEVWRLELEPEPLLLVNQNAVNRAALVTAPVFAPLVLPEVLRQVLKTVAADDAWTSDQESWQARWVEYTKALGAGSPPPAEHGEDERDDWMAGAVARFCEREQCWTRFLRASEDQE